MFNTARVLREAGAEYARTGVYPGGSATACERNRFAHLLTLLISIPYRFLSLPIVLRSLPSDSNPRYNPDPPPPMASSSSNPNRRRPTLHQRGDTPQFRQVRPPGETTPTPSLSDSSDNDPPSSRPRPRVNSPPRPYQSPTISDVNMDEVEDDVIEDDDSGLGENASYHPDEEIIGADGGVVDEDMNELEDDDEVDPFAGEYRYPTMTLILLSTIVVDIFL